MDLEEEIQRINMLENYHEQAFESGVHEIAEQYSELERSYIDGLSQRMDDILPVVEAVRIDRDYDQAREYILEQTNPEYSLKE